MQISIDKILVPTDFSENSDCAYPYVRQLAEAFNAKIVLAYIADVSIFPSGFAPIAWESIATEMKHDAEERLAVARRAFENLEVETVAREGSASAELVRLADEAHADLIVLSTHGRTGVKHMLMGSTAERVVRTAKCPVLTVHPDDRNFALP